MPAPCVTSPQTIDAAIACARLPGFSGVASFSGSGCDSVAAAGSAAAAAAAAVATSLLLSSCCEPDEAEADNDAAACTGDVLADLLLSADGALSEVVGVVAGLAPATGDAVAGEATADVLVVLLVPVLVTWPAAAGASSVAAAATGAAPETPSEAAVDSAAAAGFVRGRKLGTNSIAFMLSLENVLAKSPLLLPCCCCCCCAMVLLMRRW